jgi:hypothetical protein
MLYQYYKPIKTALEQVRGINSVEWYNNQYDGTILNDKVVWIEFPEPVAPVEVSKEMLRADIRIRLHVVSRVLQRVDSAIPDSEIIAHETMTAHVLEALRATQLTNDNCDNITSKLRWVNWQHYHKYEGWMVTWIEFAFRTGAL